MYVLNKDSRASRFYSWVWNYDVTKFKTICPYFWRFGFTVLFLPLILIGKIFLPIVPEKIKSNKIEIGRKIDNVMNVLLVVLGVLVILMFIYLIFTNLLEALSFILLIILYFVLWFFAIYIVSLVFPILKYIYKKMCPLIKWENSNNEIKTNNN